MSKSRSDVETRDAMWSPGRSCSGFLETEDLHAWRCNGFTVEVIGAVEVLPCGGVTAKSRGMEEVESEFSLRDKEVPGIKRKVWIACTKHCNEVIFPCANGTFSLVGAMVVGWHILNFDERCVISTVTLEQV